MAMPKLKRVKISSERDLRDWLTRNTSPGQEVMLVTCNKRSRNKHVTGHEVRNVLSACGWTAGPSYTLDGGLVGHVARIT